MANGQTAIIPDDPAASRGAGFGLPAMRSLGDLRGALPTVIVENREQLPLPINRLPHVRGTLPEGDYSCQGLSHLISLERKSLDDLFGTLSSTANRDRFFRELAKLRGYRFKRIIIVGSEHEVLLGERWSDDASGLDGILKNLSNSYSTSFHAGFRTHEDWRQLLTRSRKHKYIIYICYMQMFTDALILLGGDGAVKRGQHDRAEFPAKALKS